MNELGTLPRLGPGVAGQSGGAIKLFHKFRRQLRRPVITAAPLARVRTFIRVRRKAVILTRLDPIADLRRGELTVRPAAEERELLGAKRQCSARHERFLIPIEQRGGSFNERDFPGPGAQCFVGGESR